MERRSRVPPINGRTPRPPNSVIYVNFGMLADATKQQLIEFGIGIDKSGHPFLWIIRSDMMINGESSILPP